jgi:hypothetical protein
MTRDKKWTTGASGHLSHWKVTTLSPVFRSEIVFRHRIYQLKERPDFHEEGPVAPLRCTQQHEDHGHLLQLLHIWILVLSPA